jgi:hypothetical protein
MSLTRLGHFVRGKEIRVWESESVERLLRTLAPINSIATECSEQMSIMPGRGSLLLPTHDLPVDLKLTIKR